MNIRTHGLEERYAYPCSKASVREAFGDSLLDGACFGIRSAFEFEPRYAPRPKIEGTVMMALSVTSSSEVIELLGRTNLYVYRVLKEDLSEPIRAAVVDLMRGRIRQWLEAKLARSETEVFGTDKLLVELRDARLLLHETLFR